MVTFHMSKLSCACEYHSQIYICQHLMRRACNFLILEFHTLPEINLVILSVIVNRIVESDF